MITALQPPDGLLLLISVMVWQPITGYVIFMNENKAGWLSEVFGEGGTDIMFDSLMYSDSEHCSPI